MEHFYENIEGWFDFHDIYLEAISNVDKKGHFVEVGSWRGRSAAFMGVEIANSGKDIQFDCVDIWEWCEEYKEHNDEHLYDTFINNMSPLKGLFNPIRKPSVEASKMYEDKSLDFVFIDASHLYENVLNDVTCWKDKVKDGGILAGHDYFAAEVKRAVLDVLPRERVFERNLSWFYRV